MSENNKDMKLLDKFKNYSIVLFNSAIFAAMVQGAAVSFFALMQKRPPAPHRYYDAVSGFDFYYFFAFFKYLFLAGSIVAALLFLSRIFLKQDEDERVIFIRYVKIFLLTLGVTYLPMLITASLSSEGWLMLFAGLKAMMPLTAIATGFTFDKRDLKTLSKFIDLFLLGHLAIAILQKIFVFVDCGAYTYGCEQIRMTGMFIEPNTLGGVVLIKILLNLVNEAKLSNGSLLVICGILYLSQSKTNIVIFIFCLFFLELKVNRLFWIYAVFSILTLFYLIVQRGFESLYDRFLFLKNVVNENIWFGNGFGQGTQAHTLFKNFNYNISQPPLLDSQISSILYQGGIWYLFILIALSLWLLKNVRSNLTNGILIIFWLSAGTIMVMEAWPLNIVIFMTIGYLLKRYLNFNNFNSNDDLEIANRN